MFLLQFQPTIHIHPKHMYCVMCGCPEALTKSLMQLSSLRSRRCSHLYTTPPPPPGESMFACNFEYMPSILLTYVFWSMSCNSPPPPVCFVLMASDSSSVLQVADVDSHLGPKRAAYCFITRHLSPVSITKIVSLLSRPQNR